MDNTIKESRTKDAELHTLLYGVPCEWRVCEDHKGVLSDIHDQATKEDWSEDYLDSQKQPCVRNAPDKVGQGWPRWSIVPFYGDDIAIMFEVQRELSKRNLDLVFASEICDILKMREYNHFSIWAIANATAAQRRDTAIAMFYKLAQ